MPPFWVLCSRSVVLQCSVTNWSDVVSLGKSSMAALERLCQQTEVLLSEISEQGGAGAFINMDHDFLR